MSFVVVYVLHLRFLNKFCCLFSQLEPVHRFKPSTLLSPPLPSFYLFLIIRFLIEFFFFLGFYSVFVYMYIFCLFIKFIRIFNKINKNNSLFGFLMLFFFYVCFLRFVFWFFLLFFSLFFFVYMLIDQFIRNL